MLSRAGTIVAVVVLFSAAFASRASAQYTLATAPWSSLSFTNANTLEAVDSTGSPTYTVTGPVLYEGIVLNNPADMTDSQAGDPNGTVDPAQPPTSIPFNPDPYWQVFVQSVDVNKDGDFGGVAVYAGQNYGNVPPALTFPGGVATPDPTQSYTAEAWYEGVQRISTGVANNVNSLPAVTDSPIVAGDLVIVEALGGLSFGGKMILNEEHEISPTTQFQFVNLGYVGLPTATPLHIADIWDNSSTNNGVLFDPTRQSGGERYESTLVQLEDVELVSGQAANWVSNGYVTVQDSYGRQFTVELGTNANFTPANAPTGMFDVSGIFDKESSSSGTANTTGYQLWVMDPTTVVSVPYSQSYTWTNGTSGTLTLGNSSNWVEGTAPSGANTDQFTFGNAATSSYSANVDGSQGPWTTNNLTFVNVSGVTGTIAPVNGGSLILSGVSPSITQLGAGPVAITAPIQFNANASINGNGTGNVALSGQITLASSVTLEQSFTGTVEIDSVPVLNASSALQIDGGTMLFDATSGAATISSGVTATVGAAATLQLAGSVSAMYDPNSGNRVNIVNNGSAANGGGLLVTGTNQSAGTVTGASATANGQTNYAGDTVVGTGSTPADLTVEQILQNSLTINAGATVTILPAGASSPGGPSSLATVEGLVRSGAAISAATPQSLLEIDDSLAAAAPGASLSALDAVTENALSDAAVAGGQTVSSEELLSWLDQTNTLLLTETPTSAASLANLEGNLLFGDGYDSLADRFASSGALTGGAAPVPEPSSLALIAAGLLGIACFMRRRKR